MMRFPACVLRQFGHRRGTKAAVAVVLAMASAATVQAAPADAASVFCKTNVETCSKENTWPLGTEFSAATKETNVIFETAFTKQACAESSLKAQSESTNGSGNLVGRLTSLSFGKCTAEIGGCKGAEARNLPWAAEFIAHAESISNQIVLTSGGSGKPTIRVICSGFPCTYAVSPMELNMPIIEGLSHVYAANVFLERVEGVGCETKMEWNANYNSVTPEALFLTKG